MSDVANLLILVGVGALVYMYVAERSKNHLKTVKLSVEQRKKLLEKFDEDLQNNAKIFRSIELPPIPAHMLEYISNSSEAPKFFTGKATTDIKTGEPVSIVIDYNAGETRVTPIREDFGGTLKS